MKPTPTELKAHIKDDPNDIGLTFDKQNNELVRLLNQPGYGPVEAKTIDRGSLMIGLSTALLRLADKPESLQRKWDRISNLVYSAPATVDLEGETMSGLFSKAVAEGVVTLEEVAALKRRSGTYSEVVFGDGVTITRQQIAEARL